MTKLSAVRGAPLFAFSLGPTPHPPTLNSTVGILTWSPPCFIWKSLLQRYRCQGILRCVRTVRASITERVHCVGRDQAVGRLSTVSISVKEGVFPAEESFHLDVETHQYATPSPVFTQHPQSERTIETSYPLRACIGPDASLSLQLLSALNAACNCYSNVTYFVSY